MEADAARTAGEQPLVRRRKTDRPVVRTDAAGRDSATGAADGDGVRLPAGGALNTFWPLLVVLGLIVACVAALRRWMPNATRMTSGGAVHVLARQYLSSKQSLCLVRLGQRVLLVGVTPAAMTTLTEVRDREEIAQLVSVLERGKASSFSTALARQAAEAPDDAEPAANTDRMRDGSVSETEARIHELVGRIRALSTGTPRSGTSVSRSR